MPVAIRALAVSVFVCSTLFAVADPPARRVRFADGNVDVSGMRPGAAVGWMALVRERDGHRIRVGIHRGMTRAGNDGQVRVSDKAAEARRAIWSFAPIEGNEAVLATADDYTISTVPIQAAGRPGDASLQIVSAEVHVLYVRPPAGAWYYDATDGSDLDGDRMQNGTIAMPLSALQRLDSGPKRPPETVESGDYVLLIDPRQLRSTKVVVP